MIEEKLSILRNILGAFKKEGANQFVFYCPFCSEEHKKPKLSINIKENVFKCWICNTAGRDVGRIIKEKGTAQEYKEWLRLDGKVDFSELRYYFDISNDKCHLVKDKPLKLPEEFQTLVSSSLSSVGNIAKNYLTKRGFTIKDIHLYKIGYCSEGDFQNRVIVPSFDEKGKLNYFVARSFDGNKRKYMNPAKDKTTIIYNDLMVDWSEPIILVEGVFDAMRAGPQAIPILGSAMREDCALFQKIVKNNSVVYLGLDYDAKNKEYSLANKLLEYGVRIFKIPTTEEKDIGAMTKGEFGAVFNSSFELNKDSIMRRKLEEKV